MASWILNVYSCFLLTGEIITKLLMLMWRLRKNSIIATVRQFFLLIYISIVGIPKSTVLIIISRVLMLTLSLRVAGPRIIIHLRCLEMVSQERREHLIKVWWTMELLRRLLIIQWHPRKRKIAVTCLNRNEKALLFSLKNRMMHCLRIG